jgi:peptide/nickel transport system substrate-binding protein
VPAGFLVLPSAAGATTTNAAATDATSTDTRRSEAEAILFADDWVQTEAGTWEKEIDDVTTTLQVVLRTGNSPVFAATAAYLAEVWQTLGVAVEVEQFEQSDLVQSVIRPRDYQALLYGTDVTRALDFYPFWHSSQREDPGLNVALYTNITTDALLEDIRLTREPEERTELIQSFVEELAAETPAIFLYSPTFTYITNQKVHITPIARLARPSERFSLVSDWYVHHNDVWPFLQNY